jgi:site-specific recombinase XerD
MRTITVDEDMSDAPVIVIPDERVEVVEWHIAPEEEARYAVWEDCKRMWLASVERDTATSNTRRAYERDYCQFFLAFQLENLMPWQVSRLHALHWVEAMRTQGFTVRRGCKADGYTYETQKYSRATINRKVACMSSFYNFAAFEYTINGTNGERGLWQYANPFGSKLLRSDVKAYGRAVWPTTAEIMRLLDVIPSNTITGLRNAALLYGLFGTTRRVSEWIGLQWGDLREGNDGWYFKYRYKGDAEKSNEQKIPNDVWPVVKKYLIESGRWGNLQPDDYIFIAHSNAAANIRHDDGTPLIADYDPEHQPISASYVNAILKLYGRQVGIDETRLHAHGLRHAGAEFRMECGATVTEVQKTCGHKGIATTQIYIQNALTRPQDDIGDRFVGDVLPQQLRFNV